MIKYSWPAEVAYKVIPDHWRQAETQLHKVLMACNNEIYLKDKEKYVTASKHSTNVFVSLMT